MKKKYHQMSLTERTKIAELWQAGFTSITAIAKALDRSKSTISRELRRNRSVSGYYWPETAMNKAKKRRKRPCALDRDWDLRRFILHALCDLGWSPEQMAGYLKTQQNTLRFLSHESIYRWIYGQKEQKLWQYLARRKKKRGLRKHRKARGSNIPGRVSIHERPEIKEFGHWENDLMSFRQNSQHMLVSLEKKSRYVQVKRLLDKTAKHTIRTLKGLFEKLPARARKSSTFDNGGEFARHETLRHELSMATFFCDPYASWQKGAVENANGFLRRLLPRKTNIKSLSNKVFERIIHLHNTKPRKCLGWKSPLQVFNKNLLNVALHT